MWAGAPAPLEYIELTLLREMGWTYEDLDRTSAQRVFDAFAMFGAEGAVRKQRERDSRMRRRRR